MTSDNKGLRLPGPGMMCARTGRSRLQAPLAVVLLGLGVRAAGAPRQPTGVLDSYEPLVGVTVAARDVSLGPIQSGRISVIPVREGDTVSEGDLLFSLNDAVARARVAITRIDAESTCQIDLARERWKQARQEYDQLASLQSKNSASTKEFQDAFSRMEIARLEHEVEKNRRRLLKFAYEREKAAMEELHVRAPFSGYVADQLRFVGESPDQREAVLRIVQLDPLHVVLDCPLSLEPVIAVGDVVEVTPVERHWSPRPGRVIMKHRVADAASQTFRVRVSVPNADLGWMSGLKVLVTVPLAARSADASDIEAGGEPEAAAQGSGRRVARSPAEKH